MTDTDARAVANALEKNHHNYEVKIDRDYIVVRKPKDADVMALIEHAARLGFVVANVEFAELEIWFERATLG